LLVGIQDGGGWFQTFTSSFYCDFAWVAFTADDQQ
jgi:hypothetical protein